ncbi:hypothetical protein DM01DRAFT_207669 [Hesseltinella vesiculosa]|uniref:Uncharacterized protein n=1 Tax=Hesseltinella vesiculosa TaxID=101127 RepID=A0A1X2GLH1_9FUNG|nr:hypothetical protein DM01DRAFT_207669 [Hesseltinella vesiculosa]
MAALQKRAAIRWIDQGETNSKYFYNMIKTRNAQQTITVLKTEEVRVTDSRSIISHVKQFYYKHSPNVVKYLGFPIYCSKAQLRTFWDNCAIRIDRQCQILRERKLSIRGTSLLCNSVILASLWHTLRITPITEASIRPIRSSIRKFVMPFNPAPS